VKVVNILILDGCLRIAIFQGVGFSCHLFYVGLHIKIIKQLDDGLLRKEQVVTAVIEIIIIIIIIIIELE
jgi:hypothetical protein